MIDPSELPERYTGMSWRFSVAFLWLEFLPSCRFRLCHRIFVHSPDPTFTCPLRCEAAVAAESNTGRPAVWLLHFFRTVLFGFCASKVTKCWKEKEGDGWRENELFLRAVCQPDCCAKSFGELKLSAGSWFNERWICTRDVIASDVGVVGPAGQEWGDVLMYLSVFLSLCRWLRAVLTQPESEAFARWFLAVLVLFSFAYDYTAVVRAAGKMKACLGEGICNQGELWCFLVVHNGSNLASFIFFFLSRDCLLSCYGL